MLFNSIQLTKIDMVMNSSLRRAWYQFEKVAFKRKKWCVARLHLEIYKPIAFSLWHCYIENCTVWYKFEWLWPSFTVTSVQNSQNLCAHYLAKFSNNKDGIWHVVSIPMLLSQTLHRGHLWNKNFIVQCFVQTSKPTFFIPTILVAYYLIPLSVTLTLAGVTRSVQSKNLLA